MHASIRRPRHTRAEAEQATRVTDRQRLLFNLLDPFWHFKYLTSAWAHEFVGGNEHAFKVMLRNLYDASYLDRPPQQRNTQNSNYKHLVYERTAKAARLLSEETDRALAHRSNSYAHEMLVDLGFYAPLRFAVKYDPAFKLYTARNLFSAASFLINTPRGVQRVAVPEQTRATPDPFLLRLNNGETLRFDGTPFVLERTFKNGTTSFIFIPGIEVDRATEPLRSKKERASLTRHLEQIATLFKERGHFRHYGFPMMMVPIITTSETHTKNAMHFVETRIGACRYLLFKTLPDLALQPHFPAPSGEFFNSPWRRVGHSPFVFDESGFS